MGFHQIMLAGPKRIHHSWAKTETTYLGLNQLIKWVDEAEQLVLLRLGKHRGKVNQLIKGRIWNILSNLPDDGKRMC